MRLLSLRLENIGPYRDQTFDVEDVHAAGIIGENGSGKSWLQDGLKWCLWGKCRNKDVDRAVRRGQTSGAATAIFRGRDGSRYKVRRAVRTDLARPKRELTLWRLDGGQWVSKADGATEAQPAIVEACGLTYELAMSTIIASQGDSGRLFEAGPADRAAVLEKIIGVERFRTYAETDGKAATAAETEATGLRRAQDEIRPLAESLPAREEALAAAREATAAAAGRQQAAAAAEGAAAAALEAVQAAIRDRAANDLERAGLVGAVGRELAAVRQADDEARAARLALGALPAPDPTATPEALAAARGELAAAEERLAAARAEVEDARRLADEARRAETAARDAAAALATHDQGITAAERDLAALPAADPLATPEAETAAREAWERARDAHRDAAEKLRAADDAARPLLTAQTEADAKLREVYGAAKAAAHAEAERLETACATLRREQASAAGMENFDQQRLAGEARAAEEAFQRALRAQESAAGTPFGDDCGKKGCRFVADAFQLAEQIPALTEARDAAVAAAARHRNACEVAAAARTNALGAARIAADAAHLHAEAVTRGEEVPEDVTTAVAARQAARDAYAAASGVFAAATKEALAVAEAADAAAAHRDAVAHAREAARSESERRAAVAGRLETLRAGRPALVERRAAAEDAAKAAAGAAAEKPTAAAVRVADTATELTTAARRRVEALEKALDTDRQTRERRAALENAQAAAEKAGRRARTRAALAEEDVTAFDELHAALRARNLDAELAHARWVDEDARVTARTAIEASTSARVKEAAAGLAVEEATAAARRLAELGAEADKLWAVAADFRRLARAHRDVPTLMIEVILPQIEDEANRLLQRVSATGLGIRFDTQRDKKDGSGKIEQLDIWVRDRSGEDLYESYSGGEKFRLDCAGRVAVAAAVAARYGVPLEMFWPDEGFGSLDEQGKAAFAETLASLADTFDLVLVTTHLAELYDVFPTQVRVAWHEDGARVQITDSGGFGALPDVA